MHKLPILANQNGSFALKLSITDMSSARLEVSSCTSAGWCLMKLSDRSIVNGRSFEVCDIPADGVVHLGKADLAMFAENDKTRVLGVEATYGSDMQANMEVSFDIRRLLTQPLTEV